MLAKNKVGSKYVIFSDTEDIKNLDDRVLELGEASVFPRNFYSHHPLPHSVSHSVFPRDKRTHYTYSPIKGRKERSSHPPWFSRFGYDNFPNEYGLGHQTYGYISPKECHPNNQTPEGMAPPKFCSKKHIEKQPSQMTENIKQYRKRT